MHRNHTKTYNPLNTLGNHKRPTPIPPRVQIPALTPKPMHKPMADPFRNPLVPSALRLPRAKPVVITEADLTSVRWVNGDMYYFKQTLVDDEH